MNKPIVTPPMPHMPDFAPPTMPAIFTNAERRRQFELANPGWATMGPGVNQLFSEFCKTYKDPCGTVNLGPISYEDARCLMR